MDPVERDGGDKRTTSSCCFRPEVLLNLPVKPSSPAYFLVHVRAYASIKMEGSPGVLRVSWIYAGMWAFMLLNYKSHRPFCLNFFVAPL